MVSTWVPLMQIETASIGDDSGGSRSKNDPSRVVVICFGRTGLGYGGVGLIRHRVVRLVGVGEATNQHRKRESKTCRRTFLKAN